MSINYYLYQLSKNILYYYHNINEYIPSNLYYYVYKPIEDCKKKIYNLDDNKITISDVYYHYTSPSRKEKKYKQKIHTYNLDTIKNVWKDLKETKIGDSIEVVYNVPYEVDGSVIHKQFSVPYIYPSNIQFPPYSLESIHKYEKETILKKTVLYAENNINEITDEVCKYAGPLNNFYNDLPSRYGIKLPVEMIIYNDEEYPLTITDNDAEDYVFNKGDFIKY